MKSFDYYSPRSLNEACAVLAQSGNGARILAGGTDVLVELRRPSVHSPKSIIDISRVAALKGIAESGDSIVIGALTTHNEVHRSELIARYAPLLRSAVSMIGSPQIRNRGTIGGNLMNAAACADTVPPLMTLNAILKLNSSTGEREIALTDFFVKPYVTTARPDEILSEIRFDKLGPAMRSSFVKLGRRNALSIARLSVAVVLKVDGTGLIEEARIVPGAAFPSWQRIREAEEILVGQRPSNDIFVKAGKKVSEMIIANTGRRWSTEYKEPVISVLVRRALEQCIDKDKKGLKTIAINVTINKKQHQLEIKPNLTLLELLREELGLTGTKCGCEIGECGACTVLLNGKAVNSCLVLAPQVDGQEILTVEGLADGNHLTSLQESFLDHDAVHCGFCTPGMLMSAKGLLDHSVDPAESDVRIAISGNLCRCSGYQQIVDAILETRETKDDARGSQIHKNART